MTLEPSPSDRLIILAPHPDDESLATGGLILRALAQGAAVKVIFGTNGDNNPWPQRWVERRWRIRKEDRQRWGAARQAEAKAAIALLGLPPEAAVFLNLPDQGTTRLHWNRDEETISRITREIEAFQPTLCAIPSSYDLHADHNALHLIWQIAEARAKLPSRPKQLHYIVHLRCEDVAPPPLYLAISDEERSLKYDAILCHKTQMVLSKERFLAYARPEESYHLPPPLQEEDTAHAISYAKISDDLLHLTIRLPKRSLGATLHLSGETADEQGLRWIAPIPLWSQKVKPRKTTHPALRQATVRIEGCEARMAIPIPSSLHLVRLYAKLQRPTLFLDQTGWRAIPLPQFNEGDKVTSRGVWGSDAGVPA